MSRSSRCASSRDLACGRAARIDSMTPKLTPLPPWTARPEGLSITKSASPRTPPADRAVSAARLRSAVRTGGMRTRSPGCSR